MLRRTSKDSQLFIFKAFFSQRSIRKITFILGVQDAHIVVCISWEGPRTLPRGCPRVSWLFFPCLCIPSFPWSATVWISPLEPREGQGDWMKPISYRPKWDTERICTCEPHRDTPGVWSYWLSAGQTWPVGERQRKADSKPSPLVPPLNPLHCGLSMQPVWRIPWGQATAPASRPAGCFMAHGKYSINQCSNPSPCICFPPFPAFLLFPLLLPWNCTSQEH